MELSKLNEVEQQMSEDFRWAHTSPDVQQHKGMYVAVYKKRVVGVGRDALVLAEQAAEKEQCHWADIAIIAVPEPLDEIPPDFVEV
jgi:hypothetical protein